MKTAQIKRLLPSIFQRAMRSEGPLPAILGVMEGMHAPDESVLSGLETVFDPRRTPDAFVPYLASWMDLEVLLDVSRTAPTPSLSTGVGRLRELVANAATLSHWRGTRKGLTLFLETATGVSGFDVNETVLGANGQVRPFHLRITAPERLTAHRSLVQRIIELEKPAYVTYELVFGPPQPESASS